MRRLVLVAAVAALGCRGRGPDCASAGANAIKVSAPGLAQIPGIQSRLGPMQEALTSRCAVDRWTGDVIACISAASSTSALEACQAQLTPDQQTTLRRTMMEQIGLGGGGGGGRGGGPAAPPR